MKLREKFNLLECISQYNLDGDKLCVYIENYSVHDFMKIAKQYITFENSVKCYIFDTYISIPNFDYYLNNWGLDMEEIEEMFEIIKIES